MGEGRVFNHAHPRCVYIYKEQCVLAAVSLGLQEKEICQIGRGHKPLFAANIVATLAGRGLSINYFVGARLGFGDGIALSQTAIH